MMVRQRVEGLNEALCIVCGEWKLLSWFVPQEGSFLLPDVCENCARESGKPVTTA